MALDDLLPALEVGPEEGGVGRVVGEQVPNATARIDEIVTPARHKITAILARYTPDQVDLLFDYFAQAAPAYREATEEIRGTAARAPTAASAAPGAPA